MSISNACYEGTGRPACPLHCGARDRNEDARFSGRAVTSHKGFRFSGKELVMRKILALAAVASLSAFAFVGYDSTVIAQDAKARVEVGDAAASGRLSLPQGITRTDRAD